MTFPHSTRFEVVPAALRRRIDTRVRAEGSITFPAVPGMLDEFTDKCGRIFAALGRPFNDDEMAHLRSVLRGQLEEAFRQSQRSMITVSYQSPVAAALSYTVSTYSMTIEEAYHEWVATREPPYFGVEPDARICAISAELGDPGGHPILDVGAGTGRNALALARRGHPVDALEVTEKFAELMREEATAGGLNLRVIHREMFDADAELRSDYAIVLVSEVVPDFRDAEQLRRLFELAARSLRSGGLLVLNTFLTDPGYVPEDAAREFAQQSYSKFYTREELADALSGLPLTLTADDSVYDYERANLPATAWPPTSWYEGWATGGDIFGIERSQCPVDLRWLVYRKD